jgi:aconitate hydratase
VTAAVISGNRNFEGRVHPLVRANYLASPPLVVAFALAGTVNIDLSTEPIGIGRDGPVYLKDIWPSSQEVAQTVSDAVSSGQFTDKYAHVFDGSDIWRSIEVEEGDLYEWEQASTYIQHPPFFQTLDLVIPHLTDINGARVLALFGNSITTDHISPAGNIASDSPAGKYLQEQGVEVPDFNSYGSRRGNDRIMTRGTFANIRLKNLMVTPREGNWTIYLPTGEVMPIYDAALKYKDMGIPSIILAGKEYGTGSSRDWAAKGPLLQGVKAVIAESFERIHRSNLVGMGILPLLFMDGENTKSLGLNGDEVYAIQGINDHLSPKAVISVTATRSDGTKINFKTIACLNTSVEVNYFRNGGILQTVLRNLIR